MKYLLAMVMVLISTVCWSAPFLVCDPVTDAETIEVMIDSTPTIVQGNTIRIDLASLATGSHTARAKACNMWGCGEESTLNFTKSIPAGSITISIVKQ